MTDAHQTEISGWFGDEWTGAGAPDVIVDREEITVVLALAAPAGAGDPAAAAQAVAGRIGGFREDTRERRMKIADEAEHRFGRKVAWGVRVGDDTTMFPHLAVPAMTRLRQPERQVLDTLVAAGVARSRADALAWCVRLVGKNTGEWLHNLREAMHDVERLRAEGPSA